jgi:hypothetical protein
MTNILTKIKESFVKTWRGEEKLTTIIFGWGVGVFLIHGLLLFLLNPALNIHKHRLFSKWYFLMTDLFILFPDSWTVFFILLSNIFFLYFLLISLTRLSYKKNFTILLILIIILLFFTIIQTIPLIIGLLFGFAMGLGSL